MKLPRFSIYLVGSDLDPDLFLPYPDPVKKITYPDPGSKEKNASLKVFFFQFLDDSKQFKKNKFF